MKQLFSFKILLFLALFMPIQVAFAAPETSGKITKLYLKQSDGLVLFKLSSAPPAACASVDAGNPFMFFTTYGEGKAMYSTILSAYLAGKKVTIGYGGGTTTRCSVVYVYFKDN